jgi:hypothetical protein
MRRVATLDDRDEYRALKCFVLPTPTVSVASEPERATRLTVK